MPRRTIKALALVLAIMALVALPAIAKATPQLQVGGEPGEGRTIVATSSTAVAQSESISVECTENTLAISMLSNLVGVVVGGGFTGPEGSPCPTSVSGVTAVISTNAASGWFVDFNAGSDEGAIEGIEPLQVALLFQTEEGELGVCRYTAPSVLFAYNQEEHLEINLMPTEFTLEQPSAEWCDGSFVYEGPFQIGSAEGQPEMDS